METNITKHYSDNRVFLILYICLHVYILYIIKQLLFLSFICKASHINICYTTACVHLNYKMKRCQNVVHVSQTREVLRMSVNTVLPLDRCTNYLTLQIDNFHQINLVSGVVCILLRYIRPP